MKNNPRTQLVKGLLCRYASLYSHCELLLLKLTVAKLEALSNDIKSITAASL